MNKIILVGKSAAGKDHLRKILEGRGFKYGISYTTRPSRPNEVDGQDYYFLEKDEFLNGVNENKWYEYVKFNGWYYGTTNKQFLETCNLFIMTPHGVSHIDPVDRKECTIIYIDIDKDIRLRRLTARNDSNDKIERRLEADENDFKYFNDFDIQITDPNF
jgi:guanylate kinase|tara:strand:+ start:1278 stop:1757 length:480 start_codon:yes stop_codon:yes gene_type:complete